MEQLDAIVVGSGQGGIPLAVALAQEGKQVAVFERGPLGGTCVNVGCYPSKALLEAAHLAGGRAHAAELGVGLHVEVDFPRVMERVRRLTDSSYIQDSFDQAGVKLVRAEAAFIDELTVSGGGVTAQAPLIVLNTGNAPFVPPIPGLAGTPYLTYQSFWRLTELPPRLLIIGGGYIGVELGQAMARLGSGVTIVEKGERLVAREEADLSEALKEALAADGVTFHLGAEVRQVKYGAGEFTLSLDGGQELWGEALLVVVGQRPNTAALNVAAAGIALNERGFVQVDERFQTTAAGIYAIGDVTGQPAFTHVSWEDFRRLISILKGGGRTRGDRLLSYAFYTDPEAGRAGITGDEAQRQGLNARVVTLPLTRVARSYLTGRDRGFYRLVVDDDSDLILGATLVGPRAGELIHVISDLMEAGVTWRQLEQYMHIHPTYAEGLPTVARLLLTEGGH